MGKKDILKMVNERIKDTMVSTLGIEITDFGDRHISGKMPVDDRTRQPFGLLHGGASVAFAETLGSMGAGNQIDLDEFSVVGIEINSSHLRAVRGGWVFGKATPIRIGRTIQVWNINIKNEKDEAVCKSRLTLAVIKNNDK
ncbi:MAG: hotdog fold thioesterase [Candidatus Marinimicrobia bacterium]|nr:hotdog fold thioesterase [Candidatus Neomarinimicrobiota bacterium]